MINLHIPERWPHQTEAIRAADSEHSIMLASPTGTGKSRVLMEISMSEIGKGRTPILINGSRTMMNQLDREAHKLLPARYVHHAYEPKNCGKNKITCNCRRHHNTGNCLCTCGCFKKRGYQKGKLNIESYERFYRRYDELIKDLDPLYVTIIVDEAHHAAYNAVKGRPSTRLARVLLRHIELGGRLIGASATVWRLSREEGFRPLFDTMWDAGPISEFIEKGILADYYGYVPLRGKRWREHAMMGQAVSKRDTIDTFGDYRIEDAEGAPYPVTPDLVVLEFQQSIAEMGLGRIPQTLIYVPRISMAFRTVEMLKEQGHSVALLCSDPRWRKEAEAAGIPTDPTLVISQFLKNEITTIVNVGIVAEGTDFPGVECVIMGIATLSHVRWLQTLGRGLRKEGDKVCRIVDMTGNSMELGWPKESAIEQSLDHRGAAGQADEMLKTCDNCEAKWGTAKKVCDDCGYEFGTPCMNCGFWRPWNYYGLTMSKSSTDSRIGWCDPCIWGQDDYKHGQMQMRERGLFSQFKTITPDTLFEHMTVKQGVRWIIEERDEPKILMAPLGGVKAPPLGYPCMTISAQENKTYSGVVVAGNKNEIAILVADAEMAYAISEMIR